MTPALLQGSPASLLASELISVATAQGAAIQGENWAEFEQLADRRDLIQGKIDALDPADVNSADVERLREALQIDAATCSLIHQLLSETSATAMLLQTQHQAFRGYGRPVATNGGASILDAQR